MSQVYAATHTVDRRKIIEVAVGIMLHEDKYFLLTQRPTGKPFEGYWEFPGGKIDSGESVEDALARELYEELGVTIVDSIRWQIIEHNYPHAYVRLFFYKVIQWSGNLRAREGQSFIWQTLPVKVAPLLPGALTMIDWLATQ
ncbi:NUDIX domain-containing protein [Candidatus Vallotiella sp. (ex Adelges kitamiensis)]|uniref:NUDIX domain-containing protein n=1 Tax=Candidatus Vallotiella sp. (ex Adelges kitamiensis) TaxID=2864217 RepID=UPI001CE25FF7|nr:NUDIX domain-containing protein [Candidatus Vallotia sp. (ex Adelges kitamiensis)]